MAFGFTALLALGTFLSTVTDSPAGAIGATVGIYIVSEILDSITQFGVLRYGLPTHYLDAWQTMFTANSFSHDMLVGIVVQVIYLVVFGARRPGVVPPEGHPVLVVSAPEGHPEPELPPGTPLGSAELRWTESGVPFVRTPEDRFAGSARLRLRTRYATVDGLRMAYVEAGPTDGDVVLLLHGEPSWSYLYRHMIPVLADAGHRVIAPDLIGMGRSDKPVQFADYSYLQHVAWVRGFLDELGLTDITVFVQDWGSLIGLRVVGDHPDRFARVVVANGRLPVVPAGIRPVILPDPPLPDRTLTLPIGNPNAVTREVPHFPGISDQFANWALLRARGHAVPRQRGDRRAHHSGAHARRNWPRTTHRSPNASTWRAHASFPHSSTRSVWSRPMRRRAGCSTPGTSRCSRCSDAGTRPSAPTTIQAEIRDTVPGAAGQAHHAYPDANHFIQEDEGVDLARRVNDVHQSSLTIVTWPVERPRMAPLGADRTICTTSSGSTRNSGATLMVIELPSGRPAQPSGPGMAVRSRRRSPRGCHPCTGTARRSRRRSPGRLRTHTSSPSR